jgi:hypothetical protein
VTAYTVELWMDVGDFETVAYVALDQQADDATAAATAVLETLFGSGNGGFTRQEVIKYCVTRKEPGVRANLLQPRTDFH